MSNSSTLCIDCGTLYSPLEQISPARIVIEGTTICEVGPADTISVPAEATRLDATQWTAVPGFIEPHVHGGGGVDVMAGTVEALNTVSRRLAAHGTTSFLATTVSSPIPVLSAAVQNIGGLVGQSLAGAQLLGIHLEGPFISAGKRGTHKDENISLPNPNAFETWIKSAPGRIRLITLAPECEGADAIIVMANDHGIRVAMGHSNATFDEAEAAAARGVCYAVHTFNAMRDLRHRDPGIVGAVLSNDRIFAELIADGVHVHPAVVKFFARSKRADRIVLITDAVSATDMPDGTYTLGTDTVFVKDGICRDSEGRLAGSTLTQEKALKNFIEWTGFSLPAALRALTINPATAIGLNRKGRIAPGADADITFLDADLRVVKTIAAGKLVFDRTVWTN